MKTIVFVILIFLVFSGSYAKVIVDLPGLLNPDRMVAGDDYMYIVEDFSVSIYSMKDFSLLKKVGKKGEGPGEYIGSVSLLPYKNCLYVNSTGKVSIYSVDGNMIKEIKSRDSISGGFTPFNEKFVGRGMDIDKEGNRYTLLNLFNKNLEREKTVIREPHSSNFEKGVLIPFDSTFDFHLFDGKLYLVNGKKFKIDVYNQSMAREKTITWNYPLVKFGEKDKQKVIKNIRSNPRIKAYADELLKRQKYPDYYPAIYGLFDNGEYLFVMTYRWKGDNIEFLIFNRNGEFIKNLFVSYKMKNLYRAYPWDIKGDRFYQLIEDEDEEWQLHENILDLK